jgi:hypothetical protein
MPPAVLFVRCDRCMDNATSYLQQRCKAKASWVEEQRASGWTTAIPNILLVLSLYRSSSVSLEARPAYFFWRQGGLPVLETALKLAGSTWCGRGRAVQGTRCTVMVVRHFRIPPPLKHCPALQWWVSWGKQAGDKNDSYVSAVINKKTERVKDKHSPALCLSSTRRLGVTHSDPLYLKKIPFSVFRILK